jgi:glycosyltransferase involved in cell wall biosynthesis
MSGPRVLMVDSERAWRGGQEQVRLLIKGALAGGASVALAAPEDAVLFERAADLGVERMSWRGGMTGLRVLRRAMASGRFDIVHSHASRAHGAVAVARLGLTARPPHVVSRRVSKPVGMSPAGRWKYLRGADAYIAISQQVRDVLAAGGVPVSRIVVVPDGIDIEKFAGGPARESVRNEFGVAETTRVVGSIAALTPEKAHADLLYAAQRVLAKRGDVRFLVVGEGRLRAGLEGLAARLGIADRVVFTGFRPDAADLLRAFDVFVMSSSSEGLGTSIMDAQAAGVPVVATRVGGIPEIVEDGASGLLVPPRSPELLADAILRMLVDDALRDACILGGSERSRGYDYRNMVYKTLDVYRRLCANSHPPRKEDAIR